MQLCHVCRFRGEIRRYADWYDKRCLLPVSCAFNMAPRNHELTIHNTFVAVCEHKLRPCDMDKHNSLHMQIKGFCSLCIACIFYSHNMGMNCDLAFAWRHTKLKVVCKVLPLEIIRSHIGISWILFSYAFQFKCIILSTVALEGKQLWTVS